MIDKRKKLDPFYIKSIKTTYLKDDGGCMYCETNFSDDFHYFDGDSDELEKYCIKEAKINIETKTMKIVEVNGFDNISCRSEYLEKLIEDSQDELEGNEPWMDSRGDNYTFILNDQDAL